MIVRYNKPTPLDRLDFGTIIEVPEEDSHVVFYYIQASKNSEDPQWIDLGQLLVSRLMHDFEGLTQKVIEAIKNNNNLFLK